MRPIAKSPRFGQNRSARTALRPAQLATVLADSPEGAARVSSLYQQVLGRSSAGISSSEIANAEAYLAQDTATGLANLRTSMAFSAEAQADIKAVYQEVLGRAASSTEISTSEDALANGATLTALHSSVAASSELTASLTEVYTSGFGSAPSAAVLTFLRQQIISGGSYVQLTTALDDEANAVNGTGGVVITADPGVATPASAQITAAAQDTSGPGYVDISGTGEPGASISATVSFLGHTISSPFAIATVGANGTWSVTNAPGSGGPGAGQAIPNGTYSVTPIEAVSGQTITGTSTSITVSGSGVSIPDTFHPAESMIDTVSMSGVAPTTATVGASASAASLVQLTNPVTAGITPMLHS